jgi:hypothetical protein
MSVAPANTASVLVAVSGVLQDPSTYSVSGLTLTFSGAPPTGTGNISARYLGIPASGVTTTAYRTITEFTATAGQTTFTPPSYTVGFIQVFRNGVLLGSADYTATNGTTIVLAGSGATSGDLITTVSFYVSSVLNAIPATAGSVGTTYLAAGSVTQTILGTNVVGTGPAFSAYMSANQTVTTGVTTKVILNTETFDTNNNFDSTTNYRFTPTVAGYYQFNGTLYGQATTNMAAIYVQISKNGTLYQYGVIQNITVATLPQGLTINSLIYLNGSTDYVELFGTIIGTGTCSFTAASGSVNYFNGCLVRGA